MKNLDIRVLVSSTGLYYKQIAAQMGISAVHLSRLMRQELKPADRRRILTAIQELGGNNDL